MRKRSRIQGLAAAATTLALASIGGWAPAAAAPGDTTSPAPSDTPLSTVETFAYPGADQILASRGITLTRGDGGITLTDCGRAGSFQIKVYALSKPANNDDTICFAAPQATGYLALNVPSAFRISTYGRAVQASLSTNQKPAETVSVAADTTKGIGESLDPNNSSVLLELRVTGASTNLPTPQPTDPALAFATKLNIGGGKRACTGALVDRYWVMTAASCFTDTPDNLATVTPGAPKDKTTATIGRTDLTNTGAGTVTDIVELVPRQDRDVVMARLATPVQGIKPLTIATGAPVTGQTLRVPSYGRTATEWVPTKLHTTTHSIGATSASGVDTAPLAGAAPLCQGDAGAPMVRDGKGATELAAVTSRSWQGDCLGAPGAETRTGATASRVDDLAGWVKGLRYRTADVKAGTHVQIVGADNTLWDTVADYRAGSWLGSWSPTGSGTLTAVDSVAIGDTVHVFAIGTDGKVYNHDGTVGGTWTPWGEVPGGAGGAKGITAAARGNTVSLQIIGSDGSLYSTTADYTAGVWKGTWEKIGTNNLKAITTSDNVVHLFAINEDGRVYTRDNKPDGSWTPWGEIPGNAIDVKGITAAARGNIVDLQIIGSDGSLYTTNGNFDTGHWDPVWTKVSDNKLRAITSSAEGNVVHLFAINEDGRVYNRDADYNAGKWTPWGEVPGGAVDAKAITATTTS